MPALRRAFRTANQVYVNYLATQTAVVPPYGAIWVTAALAVRQAVWLVCSDTTVAVWPFAYTSRAIRMYMVVLLLKGLSLNKFPAVPKVAAAGAGAAKLDYNWMARRSRGVYVSSSGRQYSSVQNSGLIDPAIETF